jgi:signal transduction histidine kinase
MDGSGQVGEVPGAATLAEVIERRSDDIQARWLTRVRADARAAEVALTDLKDGIARYLERIVASLRASGNGGKHAWHDVASEHALTRIRIGFDIEQLMHELVVLKQTVTQVLREEGALSGVGTFERLTDIIDDAVTASVKSYVQARDYEARRQRAEHLGFLAHQVRSPLTAAVLSLALGRRGTGDAEEREAALDRVARSLDRVHQLVDEVLLVGKLDAGAVEVMPVAITLAALLDDVVAATSHAAEHKGLAFEASFDAGMVIHTDPKLLVSALEHLLENAVKYTDAGSVSLTVEARDGRVDLHVRDSCAGLSREELAIVFEPFRRGHTDKGGSGLGLAIARRAAHALGGEVHAESSGERGCHFWLSIPSAPRS